MLMTSTPLPTDQQQRTAYTFLELQVAFVVFGIALAGLYPLVVMHSRQQRKLEEGLDPQTTYYLAPSQDPWARKLGAAVSLRTEDPGPPPPPPPLKMDDGDVGYSETGTGWDIHTPSSAYQQDYRSHSSGLGDNTANWQFPNLPPGWYDVRVTWLEGTDRALNSPFTIHDGMTSKGTFRVNQESPPIGDVFEGRPWQSLGVLSFSSGTCTVQLRDDGSIEEGIPVVHPEKVVIADGVRLVPVRNPVDVISLQRSLTSEEVTVQVTVTVITP